MNRITLWMLLLPAVALPAPKQHELCGVCHNETVKDFLAHPHSQAGMECNACHGESIRHRNSEGHAEPDRVAAPAEIPALCGACHQGKGATPILTEYAQSQHGKILQAQSKIRAPHCGTCHGVHSVRTAKAMEAQCGRCHAQLPAACSVPPPRVTAVSCEACHAPHLFRAKRARLIPIMNIGTAAQAPPKP
jgi:hypothetical protein